MLRGDWGKRLAIIAAVGVATLGIGGYWAMFYSAGYSSGSYEQRAKIERQHYAADTANRVEDECSSLRGAAQIKCVTEIVDSQRESERGESDLAAQWQAADWVMWAAILAGAQLIATFAGLYFVKRTLDATLEAVEDTSEATEAMRDANALAKETMQRQLRAYVVFDKIRQAMPDVAPQLHQAVFKNVGGTPAVNLRYKFRAQEYWGVLPDDFDFSENDKGTIPLVLGTGVEFSGEAPEITVELLNRILSGERSFIIWGSLEYDDVFPDTPRRRTEFCNKLLVSKVGDNLLTNWVSLDGFNGMDETCRRQPEPREE